MSDYDFIVIGDSGQDIFLLLDPERVDVRKGQLELAYGAKVPVLAKHDTVGGNAANAATAFARLGFSTALYTHVGGDDAGDRIRKEFRRNGISDEYVVIDRSKESSYNTLLSLDGERTILSFHVERHYSLPRLADASWIYLSSMKQGCAATYARLEGYLKRTGARLCFQPGTYQIHAGPEEAAALLRRTEVFACNLEEAELYLGKKAGSSPLRLIDGLRKLGPRVAVVTDGRNGAYASDGTGYWHLDVIKDVERIDTTGAGDAFAAGFTAALARGLSLSDALRWGQGESSSVIQFYGAQAGLLHGKQLEGLLGRYPKLIAKKASEA